MSTRKLAAIMFTDIVGYTSLMGSNEKKAFEFLKKNRRIQWRLIKKYRGRWLKEMGDGILASFSSSIDAVMCAVSIQHAADEMDIPLRIGIHQGDVIFEKNDVLGDGVNIASRIQGVAKTNGIVISETVYRDIRNKDGLDIESLGTQTLKGVDSPLGIYSVSCQDINILDYKIDTGELTRPLGFGRMPLIIGVLFIAILAYALYYFIPKFNQGLSERGSSILVLPFDNYTGSDTLEYFVAGMHSSLIGDIGRISSLQVKSKTTSNAYKNVEKSIPEIASELDVNVLVEGSVLCFGDSVCLQIKLVSAYPEEETLWVQDFYVEKSQILSLYNRVTKEISEEINVLLTPEEKTILAESRTVDPEAYDAYLRARYYWDQLTPEALEKSLEYYNLAMETDPTWAYPYAGLAEWWVGAKQFGLFPSAVANPIIHDNINKALEMDPNSDYVHYVNALLAVWTEWDWEKGEKEFLKVMELSPNDAYNRMYYAHLLMITGRMNEALEQSEMAVELDPLNPLIQGLYSIVLKGDRDYDKTISVAEKVAYHPVAVTVLESTYYDIGDIEKSFKAQKQLLQFSTTEEAILDIQEIYEEKGYGAALMEIIKIMEENARNNFVLTTDLASYYYRIELDKPDKTLYWLEKAYEWNDPSLPYIGSDAYNFDQIKDHPRFIELLRKMKLHSD